MGVRRLLLAFFLAGALLAPLGATCYGPLSGKSVVSAGKDGSMHPGTQVKHPPTQDEPGGAAEMPADTDSVHRGISAHLPAMGAGVPTRETGMAHPAVSDGSSVSTPTQGGDANPHVSDLGLKVRALTDTERHALGIAEGGLIVLSVADGSAQQAGFRAGDVVLMLDGVEVTSTAQFRQLMRQLPHDRPVPVLVHRPNINLFLPLDAPHR